MEENVMVVVLGDWSKDGHGISENYNIKVNYPIIQIQEAYKKSCKLTGVSFNHNNDYTGLNLNYEQRKERHICTNYEDNSISEFALEILKEHGLKDDYLKERYFDGGDHFIDVLLWFISLSMPKDFKYEIVKERKNYFNGWWGNLNVQFGYGLY